MSWIRWRQIVIAGVTGYAGGRLIKIHREDPAIVRPILSTVATAGACGAAVGLGVSLYKDLQTLFYVAWLGGGVTIVTATILVIRVVTNKTFDDKKKLIPIPLQQKEVYPYVTSGTSGAMTGGMLGLFLPGNINRVKYVVGGGCYGVVLGLLVQGTYNMVETWRKRKAFELYHSEKLGKKGFDFLGSDWWKSKPIKSKAVLAEIELLKYNIKEEELRIERLNKKLADTGI